jgi:long-chain acyl-CoA synthetase
VLNAVNLADVFMAMGRRWPDRRAVISQHVNLTYADLVTRAAQSARELRARGVSAETNVGVCLRDGAETLVLMVALWMLRATVVPLDFKTNVAERSLLAKDFDLSAVIEDRRLSDAGYVSLLLDPSWPEIIARHDAAPIADDGTLSAASAFISLTSGTTGRPKGIVIDHERMLLRSTFDEERLSGPLLNPLPLSFSAVRTHVFSALLQGAGVYFFPLLFSAQQLADALQAGEAKSLCAVPTVIRNMLDLFGERTTPLFANLDAVYCFGAPMTPAEKLKAKATLSDNFIQLYGATNCGRISALSGADLEARPDTLGRVLPHVIMQMVDDDDNVVTPGEAGIIRLRAPGMARGAYGSAGGPGEGFKDGWAYPGDIGTFDEDGFLHLLGRTSDLIIRGGANVHPAEVEGVLSECAGVREVAVVGFTKFPEGEEIAAFVVAETDLTEPALVAHCRSRLAADKRPRKFVFVSDLPRNTNGKVLRAELRNRLEHADEIGPEPVL